MGRVRAERAFGISTKHVHPNLPVPSEAALRENLRGLLADHRVMLSSGLNVEIRKHTASNATASVRLTEPHGTPARAILPLSDRWCDGSTKTTAFVSKRLTQNDVLGHDSRHALPCATRVAAKPTDVGPGSSMRAEMNSTWSESLTYAQLCESGTLNLGDVLPADESADAIAMQMDGDRVWPPRALGSEEDAGAVAELVGTLCEALEKVEPRVATTNGVGVYMRATRSLIDSKLPTRAQRHMLELGVCIFARNPLAFLSVRKRALHAAMAAHMRDRVELGTQLERLAELTVRFYAQHQK